VDAEQVWSVSAEEADRLITEGHCPLGIGLELEPPKRLFVVTAERSRHLQGRRLRVSLNAELLAATDLALVSFATPPEG
jgi:hypothetical protein